MEDFDDLIKSFSGLNNDKSIDDMLFFSRISIAFRDYFKLESSFPIAPYTWGVLDSGKNVITLFFIGNSINHQFKSIYKMRGVEESIKINSIILLKESHLFARLKNGSKDRPELESEEYVIPFYCLELGYSPSTNSLINSSLVMSLGAQVEINWINEQINIDTDERKKLIEICYSFEQQLETHNSILMEELNCLWKVYIKKSKPVGDRIEYLFSNMRND